MQVEKAPFYLSELPFIILFYFVKYFIEILMPPAYEFNRAKMEVEIEIDSDPTHQKNLLNLKNIEDGRLTFNSQLKSPKISHQR